MSRFFDAALVEEAGTELPGWKTPEEPVIQETPSNTNPPPFSKTTGLQDYTSTRLHDYTTTSENPQIIQELSSRKLLESQFIKEHRELKVFFGTCIQPGLSKDRNDWIASTTPFLVSALGYETAHEVAKVHFRWNAARFKTTEAEHLAEFSGHWKRCMETHIKGFTAQDKQAHDPLEPDEQAAFRILRDFAWRSKESPFFYTGTSHVAQRVGCGSSRMEGIFALFNGTIMERVEKGNRRAKGVKPKGSKWRWMLPLPPTPEANREE